MDFNQIAFCWTQKKIETSNFKDRFPIGKDFKLFVN